MPSPDHCTPSCWCGDGIIRDRRAWDAPGEWDTISQTLWLDPEHLKLLWDFSQPLLSHVPTRVAGLECVSSAVSLVP